MNEFVKAIAGIILMLSVITLITWAIKLMIV